MNLEVGKTYKSKDGKILKCEFEEVEDVFIMSCKNSAYYYTGKGQMIDLFPSPNVDYSKYDIIEEL